MQQFVRQQLFYMCKIKKIILAKHQNYLKKANLFKKKAKKCWKIIRKIKIKLQKLLL